MTNTALASTAAANPTAWVDFLGLRLTPDWRPGEWRSDLWLFKGDPSEPGTRIYPCSTPGCHYLSETRTTRRCLSCRRIMRENGDDQQDLERQVAGRSVDHVRSGETPTVCAVTRDDLRCQREALAGILCAGHWAVWNDTYEPKGYTKEDFARRGLGAPMKARPGCVVRGCERQQNSAPLCQVHAFRHRGVGEALGDQAPDAVEFAAAAAPILSRGDFWLGGLPEPMRSELLYALQQDDNAGYPVHPVLVRGAQADLWSAGESLLESGFVERASKFKDRAAFLKRAIVRLQRIRDEFDGVDPTEGDVWDSYVVGLRPTNQQNGRSNQINEHKFAKSRAPIDFRPIRQRWLREIAKTWTRDLLPSTSDVISTIRAFTVLSDVLANRPGSDDPSTAGPKDIQKFIERLNTQKNLKGRLYSPTSRGRLLRSARMALHYVRGTGALDHVPLGFSVTQDDRVPSRRNLDPDADMSRGIPYRVVDAALAAIPRLEHAGNVFGSDLTAEDQTHLLRTILRLMIDTGRRPGELCRLRVGCLQKSVEQIDPSTTNYDLIYTNRKAGRAGRVLPIGYETAMVIEDWEKRRAQLPISKQHDGWLFPPSTAGRRDSGEHFSVGNLARAVTRLMALIPRLESDVPDPASGGYVAFTGKVEAYSFRHAFAQRHADVGSDVDALMDLMDHRSIQTTMAYFEVSKKRKREAMEKLAPMARNFRGEPAPIGSAAAYELASVAVPLGSCMDPTNVKAGGHACPIRFKCAGCHFYRPDPSHLPAIEEHVKQLRMGLTMVTMAGTAAPWVLDAQREEIATFDAIVKSMKAELDALSDDERRTIEDVSVAMRRARALRPLLPLSVKGSTP